MDTNNNQLPDEQQEPAPAPTYAAPATSVQPPATPQPTYATPAHAQRSKKWLMWALPLALLAVAGLVAAGYYLGKQQGDDKQASTTVSSENTESKDSKAQENDDAIAEPVDTYAGWQSSADIALGGPTPPYSFKYPGSWHYVQPGEGVNPCISVSPTSSKWTPTASTVCVGTDGGYDNKSMKDIAILWLGAEDPVASSETLTVAGRPAVQVVSTPQAEGENTRVRIVTIVSNVDRGDSYLDPIGVLQVSARFIGSQSDFDAFKKDYQLIVDSVEIK